MSTGRRFYITTAIPYVNGDPHLGHALELVQADVLARNRRLRGDEVRFLNGTDDNALKNVDAALAAGLPVPDFVAECSRIGSELGPFLPAAAQRIDAALAELDARKGRALFPKVDG